MGGALHPSSELVITFKLHHHASPEVVKVNGELLEQLVELGGLTGHLGQPLHQRADGFAGGRDKGGLGLG